MSNHPIYLKYNGEDYEVVRRKEEVTCEIHASETKTRGWAAPTSTVESGLEFGVERNLADETFSMYFKETSKYLLDGEKAWPIVRESISTSNKVTIDSKNGLLGPLKRFDYTYYEARSFSLDNLKFKEASSWSRNIAGNDSSNINISVFPKFASFPRTAMIKDNQVLEIDVIRGIRFVPEPMFKLRSNNNYNEAVEPDVHYSRFFIFPRKVNQFSHQVTIADLYKADDFDYMSVPEIDKSNYLNQYDFSNITKYQSSTVSGDMAITTKDGFKEDLRGFERDMEYFFPGNIYKIGTFDLLDETHYDFESKKTIVGIDRESKRGEIIPYNFKGSLTRIFDLGFIPFLKNFKVGITSEIKQPVLDPFIGQIILDLNETNLFDSHSEQHELDKDEFQRLRDLITEIKFMPLEGLKRFDHE